MAMQMTTATGRNEGDKTMRKFLISALAVASLLTVASAASAGYVVYGPYGPVYVPTCYWTIYGQICG
jgi:hypothetical protein